MNTSDRRINKKEGNVAMEVTVRKTGKTIRNSIMKSGKTTPI